jgi:hypothetical protein
MGARSSVFVKDGEEESPVLCTHWGGEETHKIAARYEGSLIKFLKKKTEHDISRPLDRLEVGTVFADFLLYFYRNYKGHNMAEHISTDIYIEKDRFSVDDSDYGPYIINVGLIRDNLK